ncbi:PREDICTED: lipase 3-like [Wasmannia auropunctata]|uniref:lipase 3-like n=1 Tax=Wasmannia auropunctata TaxID=64793 RepID=UPI0005EE3EEE|nr:PREDICTED: lipase 3-like [Wasmannia auropunctata]XP_011695878.1 PREDICTED: lipase 3-like [Wasmannia auropunctata]XP_011695879.1 PREDICTED: lipase 3-like [Wasmannia auropunctata]
MCIRRGFLQNNFARKLHAVARLARYAAVRADSPTLVSDISMSKTTGKDKDEAHMTTPELIETHGYAAETHQICTEDGYYLTVHRVLSNDRVPSVSLNVDAIIKTNTAGIANENEDRNLSVSTDCHRVLETHGCHISPSSKLPVIINHGLVSSSADWVLLGPDKALAYVLCDNGFDVWLTNTRGNTYSKSHKYYSIKDKEFWNFSFHEIGYYDLPAAIDYILEKTGHSKLYYVGHSQGAAAFYVMASERPEYNAKVKGMISLAPAVFLGNQRSPLLKLVVHFYSVLDWGSYICNTHEWLSRNKWQSRVLRTFVYNAPGTLTKGFCNCWFHLIAGFGSDQLDKSMLPLIFGHSPAGASVKQLIHFSQLILSGSFRKYDYGTKANLILYGSTQPPKYTLERVKVPVAIFYSENDFITHRTDVQKLADNLPNVIQTEKIAYEKFNHIDYLWGRDARTILYNSIVTVLKKF